MSNPNAGPPRCQVTRPGAKWDLRKAELIQPPRADRVATCLQDMTANATMEHARPTVFQEESALGCVLLDDVGLILAFVDDHNRWPAVSASQLERRLAARLYLFGLTGQTGGSRQSKQESSS